MKRIHNITTLTLADFLDSLVPTSDGNIIILPTSMRDQIVEQLRGYEQLVAEWEEEQRASENK